MIDFKWICSFQEKIQWNLLPATNYSALYWQAAGGENFSPPLSLCRTCTPRVQIPRASGW